MGDEGALGGAPADTNETAAGHRDVPESDATPPNSATQVSCYINHVMIEVYLPQIAYRRGVERWRCSGAKW